MSKVTHFALFDADNGGKLFAIIENRHSHSANMGMIRAALTDEFGREMRQPDVDLTALANDIGKRIDFVAESLGDKFELSYSYNIEIMQTWVY